MLRPQQLNPEIYSDFVSPEMFEEIRGCCNPDCHTCLPVREGCARLQWYGDTGKVFIYCSIECYTKMVPVTTGVQ